MYAPIPPFPRPRVLLGEKELEAFWKYACDGEGKAVDGDGLSEDVRVTVEAAFKKLMAQHDRVGLTLGKEPPECGLRSSQVPKVAGNGDDAFLGWLALIHQRQVLIAIGGDALEGVGLIFPGRVVRSVHEIVVVAFVIDVVTCEPDEPGGGGIGQWSNENGLDDAEYSGVHTDG